MSAGATTVKVSRRVREELERLRSRLASEYGVRATLQELVEAMVRLGWKRRAELAAELSGGWEPVEDAEELIDELSHDLGVEDAAGDVDRVVYGGERERPSGH